MSDQEETMTNPIHAHDVVIVGGGPAGLSAAVTLARSRRRVVVLDAGEPRNAPAHGAHNLLGREGVDPLELLATGRAEATAYGADVRRARAVGVRRSADGFVVGTADGGAVAGRRLLLATGLADELPDVPGVAELWGTRVLHCPYCHGYEVRDARIAVLATSAAAMHQALLFRQLSGDVAILLHDPAVLDADQRATAERLGIRLVDGPVAGLAPHGEAVEVTLPMDQMVVDAVVVGPRMVARGELYEQLGGELTEHPFGRFIETGPMGRTRLPGVWAAGNVGNLSAMVSVSSGEGLMAGAAIHAELVMEDAGLAAPVLSPTRT